MDEGEAKEKMNKEKLRTVLKAFDNLKALYNTDRSGYTRKTNASDIWMRGYLTGRIKGLEKAEFLLRLHLKGALPSKPVKKYSLFSEGDPWHKKAGLSESVYHKLKSPVWHKKKKSGRYV